MEYLEPYSHTIVEYLEPYSHTIVEYLEPNPSQHVFIIIILLFKMAELEDLGYSGFAFAYMDDDVQFTGTSTAAECATPKLLDYLQSVIVASMFLYQI